MSHGDATAHQLYSANTAYAIDAAVGEFNSQCPKIRVAFWKDLDSWANDPVEKPSADADEVLDLKSRFYFLRADWSQQVKRPLFNFTYFRTRHFMEKIPIGEETDPPVDLWRAVAAALKGDSAFFALAGETGIAESREPLERLGRLSKDFESYRRFLETCPGLSRALRLAASALKDPGELDSEELHHYLLSLYTRMPVEGGIPSALEAIFCKKVPTAALLRTVPPMQTLPSIQVVSCQLREDGLEVSDVGEIYPQADLLVEYDEAKDLTIHDLYQFLDSLFRNVEEAFGPLRLRRWASSRKDEKGETLLYNNLLFFPVYAYYSSDHLEPSGPFLGWLFQFLPQHQQPAMRTLCSLLEGDAKAGGSRIDVLRKYLEECRQRLPLLASNLVEIASGEVLIQDIAVDSSRSRQEESVEFLARQLQRSQPWQTVTKGTWNYVDSGEYWKPQEVEGNRITSIEIRLDPSPLDDRARWGFEDASREQCRSLLLVAENDGILLPSNQQHSFYKHFTRQIRALYRQLKLREAREKAEGSLMLSDLAHTFAHTFVKLGVSISTSVGRRPQIGYLKSLAGRLLDLHLEEEKDAINHVIHALEDNPATDLYDYFFKSLNTFNSTIQLVDQGITLSPHRTNSRSLTTFLEETYERAMKIGRQLPVRQVNQIIREAEKRVHDRDGGRVLRLDKELALVSLRNPDVVVGQEEYATVWQELLSFAFIEIFLNCFAALNAANRLDCEHLPTVSVGLEHSRQGPASFTSLTVRNFIEIPPTEEIVSPPSEGGTDGHDIELLLRRPTAEKGLSGWGWFGTDKLLDEVLRIGRVRRFCRSVPCRGGEHWLGIATIDLERRWIERVDIAS